MSWFEIGLVTYGAYVLLACFALSYKNARYSR